MNKWYNTTELPPDTLIQLSNTGYTNEELAKEWLKHFIKMTGASKMNEKKLLIVDSHVSHCTYSLLKEAEDANIQIYALPSHLTHAIQPLDVGIFSIYKRLHSEAIIERCRAGNFVYNVTTFLQDLKKLHQETFKPQFIKSAWFNAGLWPISANQVLQNIKKYAKRTVQAPLIDQSEETTLDPELPQLSITTPKSYRKAIEMCYNLRENKDQLSSPSRNRTIDCLTKGTEDLLNSATLTQFSLDNTQNLIEKHQKQAISSRRTIQKGGALYSSVAQQKINKINKKLEYTNACRFEKKYAKRSKLFSEYRTMKSKKENRFLRKWNAMPKHWIWKITGERYQLIQHIIKRPLYNDNTPPRQFGKPIDPKYLQPESIPAHLREPMPPECGGGFLQLQSSSYDPFSSQDSVIPFPNLIRDPDFNPDSQEQIPIEERVDFNSNSVPIDPDAPYDSSSDESYYSIIID